MTAAPPGTQTGAIVASAASAMAGAAGLALADAFAFAFAFAFPEGFGELLRDSDCAGAEGPVCGNGQDEPALQIPFA